MDNFSNKTSPDLKVIEALLQKLPQQDAMLILAFHADGRPLYELTDDLAARRAVYEAALAVIPMEVTEMYDLITQNEHFRNLADFLREPLRSGRWLYIEREITNYAAVASETTWQRANLAQAIFNLLDRIASEMPASTYSRADLAWLVRQLDGEGGGAVVTLLLASARASQREEENDGA